MTTEGFRDSIEIAYEHRFEQSDLNMSRPAPLIPRHRRFGVPERVAADGSVLLDLDEGAVRDLGAQLARDGVQSVAIGFLHSYVNEDHERRAAAILQAALPEALISLSCEVSPEIREYDRISTTVANAYVRPLMEGYLRRLEERLGHEGFHAKLLMITSSGRHDDRRDGLPLPDPARRIRPRGRCDPGQEHRGRRSRPGRSCPSTWAGRPRKICLVDDYQPLQSRSFEVAREYRFLKGPDFRSASR